MTETYYKFLNEDGCAKYSLAQWHLPTDKPGKWMPEIGGELIPCVKGYHLCRESDLLDWLGPTLYEAEYEGELIETNSKVVVRKARLLRRIDTWNDRTARLFACDCAERALMIRGREAGREPDEHSWKAIEVARAFARGEATTEELEAAWGAARTVARAAAWAVAWDAAEAAARAARAVAWAAVEREWQTPRLMEYLEGTRT